MINQSRPLDRGPNIKALKKRGFITRLHSGPRRAEVRVENLVLTFLCYKALGFRV